MKVVILSDIHGYLSVMEAVYGWFKKSNGITGIILLGDIIDYGMHTNEVVEMPQKMPYEFPYDILCNIRGNHEQAIISESYERFSSQGGRECHPIDEERFFQ